MRKAAHNLTRLSLELGGHAPFIVFADADLERAVEGAIASKFRNAGQTCVCANRILVEDPIRERFTALFVERVRTLAVGDGLDPATRIGPLIDDAAVEKARRHVEDATRNGASILCGGDTKRIAGRPDRFFEPTVLDHVHPEMLCCQEETFAPVAPILSFRTEEQAIELANASPYGLAAYFYTRDASRLLRVSEALEYGIVGANDALPATAQAPFGGQKHSGFGKEGGHDGIEEYLIRRFVSWGL
jgi:succinate-semialdehyde dehydrogenase/glutarate-semialdehyde dehydrogenase